MNRPKSQILQTDLRHARPLRTSLILCALAVAGCHNWSLANDTDAGGSDGALDSALPDAGLPDGARAEGGLPDGNLPDGGGPTEFSRVQTGTATLSAGTVSVNVAIEAVNPGRAFLIFSSRADSTHPPDIMIGGELAGPSSVVFHREGPGGDVVVRWYVADFQSGVSVQRGVTVVDATPTNVSLAGVAANRSFPIISVTNADSTFGPDDFYRAHITSGANLEIQPAAALQATVYWQVVEYQNADVQSGLTFLAAGQTETVETVGAVDQSKSWLLFTYLSSAGTVADHSVQGLVTSETSLTFNRYGGNATVSLAWYLISFTDDTIVQHDTQHFGRTNNQRTVSLSPAVVLERSLVSVGGVHYNGGQTDHTGDDNLGVNMITCALTATDSLVLDRMVNGNAVTDTGWFVVQFPAQP